MPSPPPSLHRLPNLAATQALAETLAPRLHAGDVLALRGDLGVGKTSFARFLLRKLGVVEEVPSPTFTLLQTYTTVSFLVYHYDFYRIKNPLEIEELGWDEACASGLVMAEWPERVEAFLPPSHVELRFVLEPDGQRHVALRGHGLWRERWGDVGL